MVVLGPAAEVWGSQRFRCNTTQPRCEEACLDELFSTEGMSPIRYWGLQMWILCIPPFIYMAFVLSNYGKVS